MSQIPYDSNERYHASHASNDPGDDDNIPGPRRSSAPSLMNSLLNPFRALRESGARLATRLGRPADGGDALDAAAHPEQYGATEDVRLLDMMPDGQVPPDSYQSKLQNTLVSEARFLVRKLGVGGKLPEDADVPDDRDVNRGVFSYLLQHQMDQGHRRNVSQASISTVASEDEPSPSRANNKKRRKQKWYEDEEGDRLKGKRPMKQIRLTKHIAAILTRQRYIMLLCRAMMKYGAPTHRLEEYMRMTANVLEIQGQFMYLPGCMIVSFDDPLTRTAEVHMISVVQGLELGRLARTHNIYKNVVHDRVSVEQAISELNQLMERKSRYHSAWSLIFLSGLASVAVGPWAFDARPIDMPIIFVLGCLLGFMQNVLAPASPVYSNVFEVSVAILMSFLARAFGSIRVGGEPVFCFSALTQSSIALILPGFSVLCSSLELQSHQIVAGSIRLVYTIIYSLFLGYGITVGITIYGLLDSNATTESSCPSASLSIYGNEYIQHFVFVAIYCAVAAVLNQARWKQLPVTVFLGVSGYVANYFSQALDSRLASTISAFAIGLLANLYSRLWHGHAAAAIVPGMFTLVSSGLATSGSIMSGLAYAESVKNNTVAKASGSNTAVQQSLYGLGLSMVQTALGITVGLFFSALVVYPRGKQRSGLFNL
ncbi:hypothetical protein BDV37DRAFT_258662 [Aspergillus pseudonomiae]|uniref:Pheromone-regulated membrane protein n=1 Tax=Aspergillus pseudonomiae TaxID=1506151 RepID=A0A5N7D1X6_9EURO|nr:uncharacterized protein BDV37DRAFT_258662 [Aspergillus pseudonomiae]KAE8400117.1 hypothetical protein BDV37DRAFT_258662 [Aspergillus pseudonomiae]